MLEKIKVFGYTSVFELAKKTANISPETREIIIMKPILGYEKQAIGDTERMTICVKDLRAASFEEILPRIPEKEKVREMIWTLRRAQAEHPITERPIQDVIDFLNDIYEL